MACSGFRGSIYITIMELGPQNHNGDGLSGPNSIIVVYMDPLGMETASKVRSLSWRSSRQTIHLETSAGLPEGCGGP